jgi:hypothetical protein
VTAPVSHVAPVWQIEGFLLLGGDRETLKDRKYDALTKWTSVLHVLSATVPAHVPA